MIDLNLELVERDQLLGNLSRSTIAGLVSLLECKTASGEFLCLCVADWLAIMTPLDTMEIGLLLQEFLYRLELQAVWLEKAEEGKELPPQQLGLADYKFATWPGREDWWNIKESEWVPKLLRPPVFTMALDVNVLWFLSVKHLGQIRSRSRSTDNVNRTDVPTEARERAGK